MFRPRVIPVLLIKDGALVKSKSFKAHRYIGDPMNAVKIFNDLKADELIILDTEASKQKRLISLDLVRDVGAEANMPFGVGGGITSIAQIRDIIGAGAEKVIINSQALADPVFVRSAAETFGSSTITVCLDVRRKFLRGPRVWALAGTKSSALTPVEFAHQMQEMGAGELIVQSIERDGQMQGYDLAMIREISQAVTIPVVALGGAGHQGHMVEAYTQGFASALAAGSMFVYHGPKHGVLINYPDRAQFPEWFRAGHQ